MILLSTLIILHILLASVCFMPNDIDDICPNEYRRLSTSHTFCKPRNIRCNLLSIGIKDRNEIQNIMNLHNNYRSLVAMGKEGLPKASDMLEMVWDDELAALAQKWAEQCEYMHDCRDCHAVPSFGVGQNLAYKEWICPSGNCWKLERLNQPDWAKIIKLFYDEVKGFDESLIPSVQFRTDMPTIGHFTQMVWAKSWRVGCGYVSYVNRNKYRQFYVCNYGPGGNIISKPVYTIGQPCSNCPLNSCCNNTCTSKNYPGLCQLVDPNSGPILPRPGNAIFYCDFETSSEQACELEAKGLFQANSWKIKSTYAGKILDTVINGGESISFTFKTTVTPTQRFCMIIKYRKGPNQAGKTDFSSLKMLFYPEKYLPVNIPLTQTGVEYLTYSLDLAWYGATQFSLEFAVPTGAPSHYLNVDSITVFDRPCDVRSY